MYAEIENIHAMAKIIKEGRQELTRAELEIMQVIWKKGKVLVHDILEEMPEPRPAYNTVSTIVRLVAKEEYTGTYMRTVLDNFFDGSVSRMVNFFSSQQSISTEETDEILRILKSGK